ncbi:hypothetical protein BN8_06657 [Fibrisoma limi BUZ 3]|uniref:Uncharacterized protein n=1 Tax=Fibrisoma limi BUZ 3 TaxID=1185876 RepID=I2GTM0_9BACT|nr:hypothetical protein BN8_06657 [Fibrisoma limi BUZ 3]
MPVLQRRPELIRPGVSNLPHHLFVFVRTGQFVESRYWFLGPPEPTNTPDRKLQAHKVNVGSTVFFRY